jgi:uncharacterized protein YjeT (DUF2065 family)
MPREIWVGLCRMVVFEGLLLFAVPQAWQRMAFELSQMEPRRLRVGGGIAVIVGLVLLQFAL